MRVMVISAFGDNGVDSFALRPVQLRKLEQARWEWITNASEPYGKLKSPRIMSCEWTGRHSGTIVVTFLCQDA